MRTHTIKTFTFDELSDEAKEKAIDTCRYWNTKNMEWWDYIYDDAKEVGKLLGIEINNIWFSGFCSQGDGACFEGEYSYAKGSCKAIRKYAPKDTVLHDIADRLRNIQRPCFYGLYAYIKHSGHYHHSGCTNIDVRCDDYDFDILTDDDLTQCLRKFMDWIYYRLEEENDYLTSDEIVRESLIANEIEFTEDGEQY